MKRIYCIVSALFKIIIMRVITIFIPLKKNKFFCISMLGKNYGDNIKPLSDYICSKEGAEIIWAFNDVFYDVVNCEYEKVKMYSWKYYYHIMTSKYILNNQFLYDAIFVKRRKQIFLQTWHGTALKRLGYSIPCKQKISLKKIYSRYNIFCIRKAYNILISNSTFMTRVYREAYHYYKPIYEIGTPRNDIFFKDKPEIIQQIKNIFNIPDENRILLYAPTYRVNKTMEYYNLDFKQLKDSLKQKTGCQYSIIVRLHPNMANQSKDFDNYFKGYVDATLYPDMQELLYATDILVTDYSASMFDYMYLKRPIVLYVPDKNIYDRGFYWDMDNLPFIIINNNEEISSKISNFNMDKYKNDIENFLSKIESCENGRATENCYQLLLQYGKDKKNKNDLGKN